MSRGGAKFFSRQNGQVRRIFIQIALGHGYIVIGDGDEGEMGLFGGGHYIRHRAASIGRPRMNMEHADPFGDDFIRRNTRKLDQQPVEKNSRDHKRYSEEEN